MKEKKRRRKCNTFWIYPFFGLYAFGTPFTLLKYKPLSFIEKLVFGFSVVKLKLIKELPL